MQSKETRIKYLKQLLKNDAYSYHHYKKSILSDKSFDELKYELHQLDSLDKFYTPVYTAEKCFKVLNETLSDLNRITKKFIEPSAGNGSFSNLIECKAYDILPENDNIIQQDFLTFEIGYDENHVVFGNPPFGVEYDMMIKFLHKSAEISDVIAFVLPITQLDKNNYLSGFKLIKSLDLGVDEYSEMIIHCCFNIYIRDGR